jgi:hypothetical protein
MEGKRGGGDSLPTTTWTDDGSLLPGREDEADVLQDGSFRMVSKSYILKFNQPTFKLQRLGIRCILPSQSSLIRGRYTLIVALTVCKLNNVSISIILCVNSRYTVPRKFRGTDNWKSNWLMRTRSPTVIAPDPETMLVAAIHMIDVRAVEKMMFWPELRKAREEAILRDDFS